MSADEAAAPEGDEREFSYETFGRRFFEYAVTTERVESALASIAGDRIDVGPRSIGPGGVASITASGHVVAPKVTPREGEVIAFDVTLPVHLALEVRLAGQSHRFDADLHADLRLTARALAPLRIFIDVATPAEADLRVEVASRGFGANVLNRLADVEGELRRHVAHYIAEQIDAPRIRALRDIDVADRLERSWAG